MNLLEIFSIIGIHWLADFVLQTDQMAKNKSKSNYWLFAHVSMYCAPWLIISGIMLESVELGVIFILITGACHFVTDYFTSRLNSRLWEEKRVHAFFVSVGWDQALHYIQLFTTYYLLKGG